MKKRWYLVVMIFILGSFLFSGCGIAQEQYDAVVAQAASLQSEVSTLQSDLAAEKDKSSQLESDLAAEKDKSSRLESDLDSAQTEISALKDQVSSLEDSISEAENKLAEARDNYDAMSTEITELWASLKPKLVVGRKLLEFWEIFCKVGSGEITEREANIQATVWEVRMSAAISDLDNPEMTQLWEDVNSYGAQYNEEKWSEAFGNIHRLLVELIDEEIENIDNRQSEQAHDT